MSNDKTLSFKQVKQVIKIIGKESTVMVRGEMGIGKSSLGTALWEEMGKDKYTLVTFDCAVRSEGDIALPFCSEINGVKVTSYAPTELLGVHLGKPLIINFDELSKAPDSVINMVLPTILERRVNATPLPEGSIVFCTGNLASELVGDRIPPHAYNRMCVLEMRKPRLTDDFGGAGEWLKDFAIPAGMDPIAIAFALERPHIFAEYSKETETNPYIYKPGKLTDQFVTPRSYFKAAKSVIEKRNEYTDRHTFVCALAGFIGHAAAYDILGFIDTDSELPRTEQIVTAPSETEVPENPIGRLILTYRLAQQSTPKNIDAISTYIKRIGGETVATFVHIVTNTASTIKLTPRLGVLGLTNLSAQIRSAR